MERIPVPSKTDTELRNTLYTVMDGATPLPIVFDSEPTTANRMLKNGQRGSFGGFIYETHNDITYKYGTQV